ncbi:hypothetical protein [Magnetospirillum sulfuroxidans]|uniref:Uncharacterized protein n=1 Tax=Magnetospirillum sulfuroxidans TaxID=611300 RepID=A0ABS5ICM0_9PROT|nr:hypothetical protein [Magnetospirillum sulfuroxidans]MBR9972171.1 hypothetical protein [Magnetospirillum sulfuroxidans]
MADYRRGETDALAGEPDGGAAVFTGYQLNVISRTHTDITGYLKDADMELDDLGGQLAALKERSASYSGDRENSLAERRAAEDALHAAKGGGSPEYRHAKEHSDTVEEQLKSVRQAEGDRPLQSYLGRKSYFTFFVIIFAAELPINIPAVQAIFREAPFFSLIVALALSGIMVYFAHTLGRTLRQPQIFTGSRWLFWLTVVLLVLLSAAMILSIYTLRQQFIGATFYGRQQTAAVEAGWFFLAVNCAVYLAGCLVSIFHHDRNPDYQRLTKESKDARAAFFKIERAYSQARQGLNDTFDDRQRRLNLDNQRVEYDIAQLKNKMESNNKSRRPMIEMALSVLAERLTSYQDGNRSKRSSMPVPPVFGVDRITRLKDDMRKEFEGGVS